MEGRSDQLLTEPQELFASSADGGLVPRDEAGRVAESWLGSRKRKQLDWPHPWGGGKLDVGGVQSLWPTEVAWSEMPLEV